MESSTHLGLAERRAIKAYQDSKFCEMQIAINEAAGLEVKLTVDWDKIAIPDEAPRFQEDFFWTRIYFEPVIQALQAITIDEMGKEALNAGLKEIRITYDEGTAPASNYPAGLAFENHLLSINWRPASNADDVPDRAAAIQKLLESNL